MNYKYRKISLDVTSGLTDYEIEINGDFIFYIDGTVDAGVKIDDISNDMIPLESKGFLRTEFKRLFLTVAASAETLSFIISNGMDVGGQSVSVKDGEITSNNITEVGGTVQTAADLSAAIVSLNNNIQRNNGYISSGTRKTVVCSSIADTVNYTNIITAPTGKTLYVYSIEVVYDQDLSASTKVNIDHTNSSNVLLYGLMSTIHNRSSDDAANKNTDIKYFNVPYKVLAGEKIQNIPDDASISGTYISIIIDYCEVTN